MDKEELGVYKSASYYDLKDLNSVLMQTVM